MSHTVQAFFGPLVVLRRYRQIVPEVRVFALTPQPQFFAMPLDDDLRDRLHASYGTGDWEESGPALSSGDKAFAAKASQGAQLAYLETDFFGGAGVQGAAVWEDTRLVMAPASIEVGAGTRRPISIWPINTALKRMGIKPLAGADCFETIGLHLYRSVDAIRATATEIDMRQ